MPTVVRVETDARIRMGRVLDNGAAGVMLPRMDSALQVSQALTHLRFPPRGDRGVATYNRACRFGLDPGALDRADEEILVIAQIESAAAVAAADEIAAIDGVDVLFIGPRDLSHDLGVPGDTTAPAFVEALETVLAAGKRHGKACGLLVNDGAAAAQRLEQGWAFVAIGSDSTLLAAASRVGAEPGPTQHITSLLLVTPLPESETVMVGHVTDKGITELGVGLISVGWMGKLHSRAYQAIPLVYPELNIRPRLVHAADTAPDRADYARDVLGYARGSTDYRDVLADPEVDVVSICAPNLLHREIGIAAAKAGKPFWIEKPVGRDAVDTAAVAAAAAAGGRRDLHRLQLPARPRRGTHPRADRERRAGPDHQRPRGLLQRLRLRAQRAPCPGGSRRTSPAAARSGDLLSHVVDLMQYVVGPITDVSGLLSTVHQQRPILPMGQATHFAVIEDGELGDVENDDYAAALVRFSADSPGAGAVGTLEASRVIVGPQCGLGFEVYGTEGSASWNFEQMNELKLALGRTGPSQGYTTILGNASQGDYAAFQPGPGNSMGYDDLKVVEAKKFLVAVTGGEQRNSTIQEALADAEVIAAAAASAVDGQWHQVPQVPGATFGHTRHPVVSNA